MRNSLQWRSVTIGPPWAVPIQVMTTGTIKWNLTPHSVPLYIVTYGYAEHNESARGSISNFALAFKIRVNCMVIFSTSNYRDWKAWEEASHSIGILRYNSTIFCCTVFFIIQKVSGKHNFIQFNVRLESIVSQKFYFTFYYFCRLYITDSELWKIF